jgi:hypothetical protein
LYIFGCVTGQYALNDNDDGTGGLWPLLTLDPRDVEHVPGRRNEWVKVAARVVCLLVYLAQIIGTLVLLVRRHHVGYALPDLRALFCATGRLVVVFESLIIQLSPNGEHMQRDMIHDG